MDEGHSCWWHVCCIRNNFLHHEIGHLSEICNLQRNCWRNRVTIIFYSMIHYIQIGTIFSYILYADIYFIEWFYYLFGGIFMISMLYSSELSLAGSGPAHTSSLASWWLCRVCTCFGFIWYCGWSSGCWLGTWPRTSDQTTRRSSRKSRTTAPRRRSEVGKRAYCR